ncbi:MAG: MBL fold metallo-hydrolase [Planctomycetota bacterium]
MIRDLSITVLVENTSTRPGLASEHGLALWIEADAHRILLDTGAGACLLPNADALGIDLHSADALVLSHGHCDHSGAVAEVLDRCDHLPVYYHPDALMPRFSARHGTPRRIGMPTDAIRALSRCDARPQAGVQNIRPGIWCTGEIPRSPDLQPNDPMLFSNAGCTIPDPLRDDQALVIDTIAGLLVISGCCHAGIGPTLRHVHRLQPERPILALIGGLHLKACSPDEAQRHIRQIHEHGVGQVLAGHCTGNTAEALLAAESGCSFAPLRCGDHWRLKGETFA